jgi:hypothetical protein|tara:strand:- start:505 stop:711 length:207 start_codon:yes stop_codon:yes gene_type:complete
MEELAKNDFSSNEKTFVELKELYVSSMSKSEKIAYEIAVESLESSYDMIKSIGFNNFIESNNYNMVVG